MNGESFAQSCVGSNDSKIITRNGQDSPVSVKEIDNIVIMYVMSIIYTRWQSVRKAEVLFGKKIKRSINQSSILCR